LRCRKVSEPEAIWWMLNLRTIATKPEVKFIDNNLPEKKLRILKKEKELEVIDPESTDIYESGALEYYLRRPRNEHYENLSFLEFMRQSSYTHT
jgi:hypothetical protein